MVASKLICLDVHFQSRQCEDISIHRATCCIIVDSVRSRVGICRVAWGDEPNSETSLVLLGVAGAKVKIYCLGSDCWRFYNSWT